MEFAFDIQAFAQYLREKGLPPDHARAHAHAARYFVVVLGEIKQQDLVRALDRTTYRLTVRLGAMLAAGIALLGALIKLL